MLKKRPVWSGINKGSGVHPESWISKIVPFGHKANHITLPQDLLAVACNILNGWNHCFAVMPFQQTFHSLSLTTSPSTATGFASIVKVQVRVDDQDVPQFSRVAMLAGVSPPATEADLQSAEQRQQQLQSQKEMRALSRKASFSHKDSGSHKESK